jgi:DNA-directed RNA polymerase specialized sigma24 family protein
MYKHSTELDALFQKFKQGNVESLDALLKRERPFLFDYAMRMTGQISKSKELIDESFLELSSTANSIPDVSSLRVKIYGLVRSNGIEEWSAETSRLENAAYLTPHALKMGKTLSTLISIEHVIRTLTANQREVFILFNLYQFSNHDIVEIMDQGSALVDECLDQSMKILTSTLPNSGEDMQYWLQKLMLFPEPVEELVHTQNLSLVIKDIKRSSYKSYVGALKLIFWFLIALVGIYVVTHSGMIAQAIR